MDTTPHREQQEEEKGIDHFDQPKPRKRGRLLAIFALFAISAIFAAAGAYWWNAYERAQKEDANYRVPRLPALPPMPSFDFVRGTTSSTTGIEGRAVDLARAFEHAIAAPLARGSALLELKKEKIVLPFSRAVENIGGDLSTLHNELSAPSAGAGKTAAGILPPSPIEGGMLEQGYLYVPAKPEEFLSPKGNTNFMDKKVQARLYLNNERIESISTPISPVMADAVFFSTSLSISGDVEQESRLYSYNLRDNTLVEVYREKRRGVLRTIGIEGSKLVVFVDDGGATGSCFSPWRVAGAQKFLELAHPAAGLQPFIVPESQRVVEEKKFSECQKKR